MDSIVKQLKQFKADAIYEKKKHYNAAERKRRYYRILSFIQIFLNAITGTTLLTVVFGKGSKMAEIIALILTIIATILASIQKICDYEKQAQGNAKAADMYLRISKKISLTLNFIKDKLLPISLKDVSCFYTADKNTYVYLKSGNSYPYAKTLEQIISSLSPADFIRANKQFIISRDSVKDITIWFDSRLLVTLDIEVPERIYISKNKASEFKSWIVSLE